MRGRGVPTVYRGGSWSQWKDSEVWGPKFSHQGAQPSPEQWPCGGSQDAWGPPHRSDRWYRPGPGWLSLSTGSRQMADTLLLGPSLWSGGHALRVLWISLLHNEFSPIKVHKLGLFSLLPQDGYSLISDNNLEPLCLPSPSCSPCPHTQSPLQNHLP